MTLLCRLQFINLENILPPGPEISGKLGENWAKWRWLSISIIFYIEMSKYFTSNIFTDAFLLPQSSFPWQNMSNKLSLFMTFLNSLPVLDAAKSTGFLPFTASQGSIQIHFITIWTPSQGSSHKPRYPRHSKRIWMLSISHHISSHYFIFPAHTLPLIKIKLEALLSITANR